MENKKISVEMADMIGKTYFSIATWFNNDYGSERERQEALKSLSAELIQNILEDLFLQIEGVGGTETKTVKNKEIVNKDDKNQEKKASGGIFEPASNSDDEG